MSSCENRAGSGISFAYAYIRFNRIPYRRVFRVEAFYRRPNKNSLVPRTAAAGGFARNFNFKILLLIIVHAAECDIGIRTAQKVSSPGSARIRRKRGKGYRKAQKQGRHNRRAKTAKAAKRFLFGKHFIHYMIYCARGSTMASLPGFFNALFAIALPIILQNFLQTFVNMLDTIMVGRLGATEIAAAGLGNQIFLF